MYQISVWNSCIKLHRKKHSISAFWFCFLFGTKTWFVHICIYRAICREREQVTEREKERQRDREKERERERERERNVYIYIYTHIYKHMYVYRYIFVNIYNRDHFLCRWWQWQKGGDSDEVMSYMAGMQMRQDPQKTHGYFFFLWHSKQRPVSRAWRQRNQQKWRECWRQNYFPLSALTHQYLSRRRRGKRRKRKRKKKRWVYRRGLLGLGGKWAFVLLFFGWVPVSFVRTRLRVCVCDTVQEDLLHTMRMHSCAFTATHCNTLQHAAAHCNTMRMHPCAFVWRRMHPHSL